MKSKPLIDKLLHWFNENKRNLPWRIEKNPYKIWLSEVILQQTRVAQGISYYEKFVENYPTVDHLAEASEQEVLNLWQGLGYYSRARNLHKAAKLIQSEYASKLPSSYKELLKIPGIGKYTAAAIASLGFKESVAAIDGNAYRVYSRVFNIDLDISKSSTFKYFFDLGNELIPQDAPGNFNEAIMELGATVCLPKKPLCMFCPIQDNCISFSLGNQSDRPVKSKKIKIKKRYFNYVIVTHDNYVLLKERTRKDIWKNLYEFILFESDNSETIDFPKWSVDAQFIYEERHILTHQHLFIKFYRLEVNSNTFTEIQKRENSVKIKIGSGENDYPQPKPIYSILRNKNWFTEY